MLRLKKKLFVCPHPTSRNFWADPKCFYLFLFFTILRIFYLEINIFVLKSFQEVYVENSMDIYGEE